MLFFKTKKKSNKSINKKTSIVRHNELNKYKVPLNKDITNIKYWELPNRKHFINWVNTNFSQYESNTKKYKQYIRRIPEHFILSNVQRTVRDYLQDESPARGILLYYGLGIGKTCTGITIAEAILSKKNVIIFSKTSLTTNWIKEIRNCGADYVKNHNHWVFKHIDIDNIDNNIHSSHNNNNNNNNNNINNITTVNKYSIKDLIKDLGIPYTTIKKNGGVFLIDFTNNISNFNDLTLVERDKLDIQIDSIIDERFEFIHSDNHTGKSKIELKLTPETLNNKIVIWDEVHNLGNSMTSKSDNAKLYYDMFMNASNVKIMFLSGTPIINRIFEITKIYNILRGYMHVLHVQFKSTFDINIDYDKLQYILKKNNYIDQIIINKGKKMISITKNPDNFITSPDNKGIVYKPNDNIDINKFKEDITKIIMTLGYKFNITETKETCFPEDEDKFDQLFYNSELNKIKRLDLIKKRIIGLTSYYDYQDKNMYPTLIKPINIIQVAMSEYQFGTYEKFRHKEIEDDKQIKRNTKQNDEEMNKSSYRIKSRLACTFAFPEEIGNPYDSKTFDTYIDYFDKLDENLDDFNFDVEQLTNMTKHKIETKIKDGYNKLLEQDKALYLDIKNGSLSKYSPKYLAMLNNIQKHALLGKIFVYSYFCTLIGLNSFSYALLQTGLWVPFRIKKVKKLWELDMHDDEINKYKFIFYTGNESSEMLEIYRKIMNSDWSNLGSDCVNLIKQLKVINPNNYRGEIIKMIMTTKKGSEGLDLKEIRFIHIMEPYWQPVLIDQVIGRGVRNGSHLKLVQTDRTVEVFIYMATIPPNLVKKISYVDVRNDIYKFPSTLLTDKFNKVVTSDEHLFLTSERKKLIINDMQQLMKDSAFDCSLNYKDNKLNPDNKNLVCIDYNTNNRDDYIYTPDINDTIGGIDTAHEKIISVKYKAFKYKDKKYYYDMIANIHGKMYIYDDKLVTQVRLPKPVGYITIKNGKQIYSFYAKK